MTMGIAKSRGHRITSCAPCFASVHFVHEFRTRERIHLTRLPCPNRGRRVVVESGAIKPGFSTRHGAALAPEPTQARPKIDGDEASPSTTRVTLCLDLMLYLAMNDQIIQHRNNLSTLGRCEPQRLHSLYGFPAFSRDFPESSRLFDDLFAQCGRGAFVPASLVSLRPLRPADCRVPPPMWIGYIELRYV